MAAKCGIYRIQNTLDGKVYVGQSVNITRRWGHHLWSLRKGKHGNPYLQAAWDKHNESSFEFSILEECSVDQLDDREAYYLVELQAHLRARGYNLNDSGNGHRIFSEETRAKMAAAKRGHQMPEKTKAALRAAHLGKPLSQERREALRESNLGKRPRRKHEPAYPNPTRDTNLPQRPEQIKLRLN